jgi:alkylated DNA repair dioxygenase AlkB
MHRVKKKQTISGKLYSSPVDMSGLVTLLQPETGTVFGRKYEKKCRQTIALSLGAATYGYTGKVRVHHPAPPLVVEMADLVSAKLKEEEGIDQKFNTAIFTRYSPPSTEDKNDKGDLNWHDDLTGSNLAKRSAVATVVFGERRTVYLRNKKDHSKKQQLSPGDGDFYVMLPGCQEEWQHRVEKGKGVRYSFTFRLVR